MAEYVYDVELIAMAQTKKAVDGLTVDQRTRVYAWVEARSLAEQKAADVADAPRLAAVS